MVFKRPRNSRDDKSTGSPNKASRGDDRTKKTGGRSGKPVSTSKLKRNHYSDDANGENKSSPSVWRNPYAESPAQDERPKRSFRSDTTGEKKSFVPKQAPYSGRPT